MTTLGLIGLGRIGAFHTETLINLPGLDGLLITDERSDVVKQVAPKYGATPVDSVDALLRRGRRRRHRRRGHPGTRIADAGRGRAWPADLLREAGRLDGRRERRTWPRSIARSGVPVQIGYQRRFDAAFAAAKAAVDSGSLGALHTVRSTTMDPAPPPMDYIKGSGGIFRDCAVHDFDIAPLDHRPGGRRGLRHRQRAGRPAVHRVRRCRHRRHRGAIRRRCPGRGVGARYNGRGYDCRLEVHGFNDTVVAGWDQGVPVRNMDPRNEFPTGQPHHFFMDRFTEAFRTELADSSRWCRAALFWAPLWPTPSRWRGSPRPPPSRCAAVSRSPSRRFASMSALRIAGAPISWGVCEVPGWGYQLSSERVLTEMREAGLTATELGPEGFLPTDTDALTTLLNGYGLGLRGWVRPRGAVQAPTTIPSTISPGRWNRWWPPVPAWWCWPPPPGPTATTTGPSSTKTNGPRCFANLDRLAEVVAARGLPRCCTRTSAPWWRPAPRSTACWPVRASRCAWTPGTC